MIKLWRMLNQNQQRIAKIVLTVIFVLLIIKTLDSYYEEVNSEQLKNIGSSDNTTTDISQYAISDNKNINKDNSNSIEETMEQFALYCNNKEVEKAYGMLTDECKSAMYENKDIFENNYINVVFSEYKDYTLQAWTATQNRYTYMVKFTGDMLSTGKVGNIIEEYYTFIKNEDGTFKININDYIYGENLDKEIESKDIKINISSIDVYKEYEIYRMKISNNTENDICLNGKKYKKAIYLSDQNDVTYSAINSDFEDEDIILKSGNSRFFEIKFNKNYNKNNTVIKLVLNDVIFNYNKYLNLEDKSNYENRDEIEFNLY